MHTKRKKKNNTHTQRGERARKAWHVFMTKMTEISKQREIPTQISECVSAVAIHTEIHRHLCVDVCIHMPYMHDD